MKRGLLFVVMLSAVMGVWGTGVASAQEIAIVNVPFQFTVNHKVMMPGKYEIAVSEDTAVITVTPQKGAAVVAPTITRLAQHGAPATEAEIVFDKAGDQYTLAEVWLPTQDGFLVNDMKQAHQHHVLKGAKKAS